MPTPTSVAFLMADDPGLRSRRTVRFDPEVGVLGSCRHFRCLRLSEYSASGYQEPRCQSLNLKLSRELLSCGHSQVFSEHVMATAQCAAACPASHALALCGVPQGRIPVCLFCHRPLLRLLRPRLRSLPHPKTQAQHPTAA